MVIVNRKEWKKIFKKDILQKLIESKSEFDLYKKSGKVVYLQQAGNKLFSVVENWLMVKYNLRVQSYKDLVKLVTNPFDKRLLAKVSQLHYFYYENVLRGEPWEFEEIYKEIYEIMKKRVKNV